jgi:hypothetical protein
LGDARLYRHPLSLSPPPTQRPAGAARPRGTPS